MVVLVLGAMTFGSVFLNGCDRRESASEASRGESAAPVTTTNFVTVADPPSVYMKDEKFRSACREAVAGRNRVLAANESICLQQEELVAKKRAAMPEADEAAVMAELAKDPEWISLEKRKQDAMTALREKQAEAAKLVGERIAPRKTPVIETLK